MIHKAPLLSRDDRKALEAIEAIRSDIRYRVGHPGRWLEPIRKLVAAEAVRGSTKIEGFVVTTDQALEVIAGHPTPEVAEKTREAVEDYQAAMNRVLTLAEDPHFTWGRGVIRDLHYLVTQHNSHASPGLWRTGAIGVAGAYGRMLYRGPEAEHVPGLMDEVADWLATDTKTHPIVRAAMAHFHVVAVHPFRDGNGRTARVAQSLVLAQAGRVAPTFASIERYLGENTDVYYNALIKSQSGYYDPTTDVTPWIRFAIRAQQDEAHALRHRLEIAYQRREYCEALISKRLLPLRMATILDACLLGTSVNRDEYMHEEDVARATAIQDFRMLVGAGLILRQGGGRNVRYVSSEELQRQYAAWQQEQK